MIIWLLPVAVAAVASPPSLPPPPEANMAAARRLVAALPLTPEVHRQAVAAALERSARYGIVEAKVDQRGIRWLAVLDKMVAWYRTQLPRDPAPTDAAADACLTEHYASLPVDALDELARFYATPTGNQWWTWEGNRAPLVDCYAVQLPLDWRAALKGAGIKPPPYPDPRIILY